MRRGTRAAAATALVLTGCSGSPAATSAPATPAPTRAAATAAASGFHAVRVLPGRSPPARLRIPAAGVDAPVVAVGRLPDGTVQTPSHWDEVGWYDGSAIPGEPGPTVLLGHVDSRSGPAVFFALRTLRRGALITVVRADGAAVRYTVDHVKRVAKRVFPTEDVYLPTLEPELRLVTCGGVFDTRSGHYVDNVIVYAQPTP